MLCFRHRPGRGEAHEDQGTGESCGDGNLASGVGAGFKARRRGGGRAGEPVNIKLETKSKDSIKVTK